jgi:hypothetical protein
LDRIEENAHEAERRAERKSHSEKRFEQIADSAPGYDPVRSAGCPSGDTSRPFHGAGLMRLGGMVHRPPIAGGYLGNAIGLANVRELA